jgi:hypothetical protein
VIHTLQKLLLDTSRGANRDGKVRPEKKKQKEKGENTKWAEAGTETGGVRDTPPEGENSPPHAERIRVPG